MSREIAIPFCGFYESWIDDQIDRAQECAAEGLAEEYVDLAEWEVFEEIHEATDYRMLHGKLAEAYVEVYRDWMRDEFDLDLGSLAYARTVSPREYNFGTDRIFATISDEDVIKLVAKTPVPALDRAARERFTSRSGFHSFYDPRHRTWGPVLKWDCNQLETLLVALTGGSVPDLSDCMQTYVDQQVDHCCDWDRVSAKLQTKQLVAAGEIEPDAREFPLRVEGTAEYVKQFNALNHLKG